MTNPITRTRWSTEERGKIIERAAYLLRSNSNLKWPEVIGRAQVDVLPANRHRKFVQQFAKKEFSTAVTARVAQLRAGIGQIPDQTQVSRKVAFVPIGAPVPEATVQTPPVEVSLPKSIQDISLAEFFGPTVKAIGQLYYDQLVNMLEVELKERTQAALNKAKNEVESQLKGLVNAAVENVSTAGASISAVSSSEKDVTAIPAMKPAKVKVAYVGQVTGSEFHHLRKGLDGICDFVLIDKEAKIKQAVNCRIIVRSPKMPHKWEDNVNRQNPGHLRITGFSPSTANQKLLEAITAPDFQA